MLQISVKKYKIRCTFLISVTTVKSESSSDRDAGFYSGEDTDFEVQYHSPTTTETSRDSVDTKESVDNRRNKRKCDKANKFRDDESDVKRIKLEPSAKVKTEPGVEDECEDNLCDRITSPLSIKNEIDSEISSTVKSEPWRNVVVVERPRSPFRPWNVHQKEAAEADAATVVLPEKIPSGYLPPLTTSPYQKEPLALVVKKRRNRDEDDDDNPYKCRSVTPRSVEFRSREVETDEQVQDLRVGRCPQEVVRINPSTGFCNDVQQFQPDGMDSCHIR